MCLTVRKVCVCVFVCEEQTSVKWQWRTFPPVKNVCSNIKRTSTATNTHLHTELLLPTDWTDLLLPIRVRFFFFLAWMALRPFILLLPSAPFQHSVRTCRGLQLKCAEERTVRTKTRSASRVQKGSYHSNGSKLDSAWGAFSQQTSWLFVAGKSVSYINDGSDLVSVYSSEPAHTIPGAPLSGLQPALMLWNTHALLLLWHVKMLLFCVGACSIAWADKSRLAISSEDMPHHNDQSECDVWDWDRCESLQGQLWAVSTDTESDRCNANF